MATCQDYSGKCNQESVHTCRSCGKEICATHTYFDTDFVAYCRSCGLTSQKNKGSFISAGLLAFLLLVGLLFGLGQNVAQAQEAGPQLLDAETVQSILDGQIPQEVSRMASVDTYPTFNIRDHWGYGSDKFQKMMNANPTQDIRFEVGYADGSSISRNWNVNQTPRDELFQRLGSMETTAFPASGGKLLSTWNEGVCQIGSMFVMARSADGTSFPTIRNFATTPIYYRLISDPNSSWRMLSPNAQEGWRIWDFSGEIVVRLSPDSQDVCATLSWDWNYQPVQVSVQNTVTFPEQDVVVPVTLSSNTGEIFSIDSRVEYSSRLLSFAGIESVGTATQNFSFVINDSTPGSVIVTGQGGDQPITAASGVLLKLKFKALRAGLAEVRLVGVETPDLLLNGGRIPVNIQNGTVTVNNILWTGAVYFWNQNAPLKDVLVTLSNGSETVTAVTGWDGGYTAPLPISGQWTATFGRQTSQDDSRAVSALDASLTHQRAAQIITLTQYAELSGNADNLNSITAYDANRILRYAVGHRDSDAVCGQWRAESITAEITGPNSAGHITKIFLMCDVSGNWANLGTVRTAEAIKIQTEIISIDPLVLRLSADQPFVGIELQFDQQVTAVATDGFDSVTPLDGKVALAAKITAVNSIDLEILPIEGTQSLTIESITIDENDPISGPSISLDPNFPLPCLPTPTICTDVQVSLVVSPSEVYAGEKVTATLIITNNGRASRVSSNVTMPNGPDESWADDYDQGETKTYTVTVRLDQSFTFIATAVADRPELRPADNKDFAIVTVIEEFPVIWLQIFLPTVGGGVRPPDGGR